MATYYSGPRYMKDVQEVTARTDGNVDRHKWICEMEDWAEEHEMDIKWQGESTHIHGDDRWHEAHFLIAGDKNRFLFRLRWA